jgi:hypothetical protein
MTANTQYQCDPRVTALYFKMTLNWEPVECPQFSIFTCKQTNNPSRVTIITPKTARTENQTVGHKNCGFMVTNRNQKAENTLIALPWQWL